jgi:hypothetical protein
VHPDFLAGVVRIEEDLGPDSHLAAHGGKRIQRPTRSGF